MRTPLLCNLAVWETSGHVEKFGRNMLQVASVHGALKPMNCPGHAELFAQRPR